MALRFLHFGAGPNRLPAPWENLGGEHDIRKRLKFEDSSADRIQCEHVIEHVGLEHGLGFLREAYRVLQPGGVLRLVFPDVTRFGRLDDDSPSMCGFGPNAERYAAFLTTRHPEVQNDPRRALQMLLTGWGHLTPWTVPLAQCALVLAGFREARPSVYGASDADGHHKDIGFDWAAMESSCVEGFK